MINVACVGRAFMFSTCTFKNVNAFPHTDNFLANEVDLHYLYLLSVEKPCNIIFNI